MKKINFLFVLLVTCISAKSQSADSLIINYYENYPYSYTENGEVKGIEVDIMKEYAVWLKQKKSLNVVLVYKQYNDFSAFYNSVKGGNSKIVGLGSVTTGSEREKEVSFSAPYLQNLAVLITSGKVPTVKAKDAAEINAAFGKLNAIAVNGSSHVKYINNLKTQFLPNLKITYSETQTKALTTVAEDNSVFCYADIIAYWSFLKTNPGKFLKIQKAFNEANERFGFIMPKSNTHLGNINEFMESGFGFTSTKLYHQILEKYLGYEIIESVELK